MTYESIREVESESVPGVSYVVARMSFVRRVELMRRVRELAGRKEFQDAGEDARGDVYKRQGIRRTNGSNYFS